MTLAATAPAFADDQTPSAQDRYDPMVTAAISATAGKLGRRIPVPEILSAADAESYRKALKLQERGDFAAADRELAKVKDDVLTGHVLANRYLNPAYRSSFAELKSWMAAYSDHPEADRVYALAKTKAKKGKAGMAGVRQPKGGYLNGTGISLRDSSGANWEDETHDGAGRNLSAGQKAKLRDLKTRFNGLVKQGALSKAEALLTASEANSALGRAEIDELKTAAAAAFFAEGRDDEAAAYAAQAAERSGDVLPHAHWIAGLALWRKDDREAARRHFEAVGNARDSSGWMVAAGAFWAARANLVTRRPELVNHWLEIAAGYPRTFYGLLARRALGMDVSFAWEQAPLTDQDGEILKRVPGGRRALALLQIGDKAEAEEELRKLYPSAGPSLAQSMLALANAGDMPDLALRLGTVVRDRDGRFHDGAFYPLPAWEPKGGWTVDKALIFAFVRQESAFNPQAKSPAGATGLMQLMPATARFIGGGAPAAKLTEPEYNLSLGQRYIQHLLDDSSIQGNMLMLSAAYNAGPGNLQRWQQSIRHNGDPLLFMEGIPSRETRIFVEKVMTNYWIYRNRMDQRASSLDAIAAGDWPLYDGQDRAQLQEVNYVKD